MSASTHVTSQNPIFVIRVYLDDGSVESFAAANDSEARRIWESVEPSRLFTQRRLVLAGEHFKSVFVPAHVTRVDFIQDTFECWEFPGGYADIVELSEAEFRKHAHLDKPEQMAKRKQPTAVGDLLVSFLKLYLAGGRPLFLMVEVPARLPAESHSFMQFMLSKGCFHMRLRGGGFGVVNLANLAGYTVHPGIAEVPADTWLVEPLSNTTQQQRHA